ncbi:MAG TPA: DUF4404 family protein [Acidimicrobiia bacterium]|jgi:hypothetical protein|nr:DUF4404 family protein [Acidimicrobiia bacterium]
MSDEAREHLEQVQGQLHEAASAGHDDAGELADQVGAYLDADAPSDEDHDALLERLRRGVLRYEASHPELSRTVQSVIDSLTASGI